jgi:3-dehydroquinate dehydratase-2
MRLLILHGPNLNRLGQRQPDVYGTLTEAGLLEQLQRTFPDVQLTLYQSNHEGDLIDRLQGLSDEAGVILNAGALTHSSYPLYDALLSVEVPVLEVHLSHIDARESFRRTSVLSPACRGVISGLGAAGYHLAVLWFLEWAQPKPNKTSAGDNGQFESTSQHTSTSQPGPQTHE